MLLGAGFRPDPGHDTITLRDDHSRHLIPVISPLRHLARRDRVEVLAGQEIQAPTIAGTPCQFPYELAARAVPIARQLHLYPLCAHAIFWPHYGDCYVRSSICGRQNTCGLLKG
jgi:hypothetical protein